MKGWCWLSKFQLPHSKHLVQPNMYHGAPSPAAAGGSRKWEGALEDRLAIDSSSVRFFYGHAAWQPGELERELQQGNWLAAAVTASVVFPKKPLFEHKGMSLEEGRKKQSLFWAKVLKLMGGKYSSLARFARVSSQQLEQCLQSGLCWPAEEDHSGDNDQTACNVTHL